MTESAGEEPEPSSMLERVLATFGSRSPGARDRRPGHLALVSADPDRHAESALRFVRHGLDGPERVLYVAGGRSRATVLETMRDHGIDVDEHLDSETLTVISTAETVDATPAAVLEHVERAIDDATAAGGTLRVVTETSRIFDGDEFGDYERRLSALCADEPVLALCGYLRERLSPPQVRDAIRAHPYVVSDGVVSRNVYYTPPAELWNGDSADAVVERMLQTLRSTPASSVERADEFGPSDRHLRLALSAAEVSLLDLDHRTGSLAVSSLQGDSLLGEERSPTPSSLTAFLQSVHREDRDQVADVLGCPEPGTDWGTEFRLDGPDGEQRWLAAAGEHLDEGDGVRSVGVVRDITERKRLQRELRTEREHFRVALENSPFTAFRLDTDLRYTWIGNPHSDFDPDAVLGKRDDDLLPPEPAEKLMAPKRAVLETGEGVREEITYDLPSGTVAYDLTVEPLRDESGDIVGLTAAAMDLSDRKRLERMLSRLHEASRALVRAPSKAEAGQRAVDAAVAALGVDCAVCYLFDDTDNRLRPAAITDALAAVTGPLPPLGPSSDAAAWRAFITDETVQSDADDAALGSGLWIPLGDHGVLGVFDPDDTGFDDRLLEAADHLAATAEATMERIDHAASVRAQERSLAEQNRRLQGLSRINDIIREIDQALIRATTTDGIEAAVCERLTRDDRFAFAWIGQHTGDTLTPQTWAGSEPGYLDEIPLRTDTEGGDPATATAATGTVSLVSNVADDLRSDSWRRLALARGLQSALSVPIQYEGLQYGVLTVYGAEPGTLDSLAQSVMAELGDTIGNAMNAVETRHALQSDTVVELKLTIHDPDSPVARLATATGAEIAVRGTVPKADGSTRVFVTVSGMAADEFRAAGATASDVERVTLIDAGEGASRFELVVSGRTIPSTIVTLGAAAERITVRDGAAELVVELPQSLSVRTFINRLESVYSATELTARRDATRADRRGPATQSALTEGMTDRQREVLQTAYHSGYFEWPRERTGEEVAAALGITQSTFNNHLRTAERKLLAQLFEERVSPPQ